MTVRCLRGAVLLTLATFTGCASAAPARPVSLAEALARFGLRAAVDPGFRVTEGPAGAIGGALATENLGAEAGDGRVLRIQKVAELDAGQARIFVTQRVFQLGTMYEARPNPYFAVAPGDPDCSDEVRPRPLAVSPPAGTRIEARTLFANERFAFGVCRREQIVYRAFVALVDCRASRSVFMFESFVPLALSPVRAEGEIRSLGCP